MDQQYNQVFRSDFSIQYKESAYNELSYPHYHADYELFLNMSDQFSTQIADQEHEIPKGTMLLFNNMDLHRNHMVAHGECYRRYVLFFKPEYIRSLSSPLTDLLACFLFRPFDDSQILPLTPAQQQEMVSRMDEIIALDSAQSDEIYGKDILIKIKLAELLILINNLYCKHHQVQHTALNPQYSRIYEVIDFIHQHFQEPLPLDMLAGHFYVNKYHLCTLFKEVTGTSINQYTVNCRITHAKTLLTSGSHVDDVCAQSGFLNLSHFSRTFKKTVGESPKQFQIRTR